MCKQNGFSLDESKGYFQNHGVDVMAFDDIYPAGHQSGVSVLMHARRVLTNGDMRLEQTPGQWQPLPKQLSRSLDTAKNSIITRLRYPDTDSHLRGFNPMIYPDFEMEYTVTVRGEGESVYVTVDLDRPIPEKYYGKACFNIELFPGDLFGKPWIMDEACGIFPRQPNAPTERKKSNLEIGTLSAPDHDIVASVERLTSGNQAYSPIIADDLIALPYASGKRFTARPDDPYARFTIESLSGAIHLYDGRMNHNNGWFVLSETIECGKTKGATEWKITPNAVKDWMYRPVVQTSQVGYMPAQRKIALIELDGRETNYDAITLFKVTPEGERPVLQAPSEVWGNFLRFRYLTFDFSAITEEGLYIIRYKDSASSVFSISKDVFKRGVWQPVIEYFLPVQMCHMRVNEKYRVWHGLCHDDDAKMAPVNYNHIDGYVQGASTLTKYQSGDSVPGLNQGGWHDAGDFDLRIESQAGEMYVLASAYEAFDLYWDETSIDQEKKTVEIHQPDGKNDILQQIEHGALSVVGAYKSLGRLYRGIICPDLRQYVLLGDSAAMTDNIKGNSDDRWVFTEDNPVRELTTAAQLAASGRALKGFNDALSRDCIDIAKELFDITRTDSERAECAKVHAAVELFLTLEDDVYRSFILSKEDMIVKNISSLASVLSRAVHIISDNRFTAAVRKALTAVQIDMEAQSRETPYGIPYRPHIWGAGWEIQSLGYKYYYLHKAFPDLFDKEILLNALNFVLGCHPGSNTASFASGVGAVSATTAYGLNRADFSFIPGGVISGTALIRPDFPELLVWPFLWQQTEYVLGGGSSHYMFLVLAAIELLSE